MFYNISRVTYSLVCLNIYKERERERWRERDDFVPHVKKFHKNLSVELWGVEVKLTTD